MALTFNWSPLLDPTGRVEFRSTEVQFGDGYSQSTLDGINGRREQWPVSFRGGESYIQPIRSFLDSHAGWSSFLWTPPGGVQGYYRCKGYDVIAHGGRGEKVYTLTAEFKQVFQP